MRMRKYDVESRTFAEIIDDRIAELAKSDDRASRARLANAIKNCSPDTVYRFLRGDADTASTNVGEMLYLVGLKIVPAKRKAPMIRGRR